MLNYLVRRCWLPSLGDVVSFAAYICFIGTCVAVAITAATFSIRVGGAALRHAAHEVWDQPPQASAGVSRNHVLDSDAFSFGYLKAERVAPRASPKAKPLKGSGLAKPEPVDVSPWNFWGWGQSEPQPAVQASPRPVPVSRPKYRTVCVRLCDGAYFPVSFSARSDRFRLDEAICQRSCTSPAKLYVYRNPGGDIDAMHDVGGEPYAKLKTAFLFRTSYDASCTCKPHPWEEAAQRKHRMYAELDARKKGNARIDAGARRRTAHKPRPEPVAVAGTGAPTAAPTKAVSELQKDDAPKAALASNAASDANAGTAAPIDATPEGRKADAPKVEVSSNEAMSKATSGGNEPAATPIVPNAKRRVAGSGAMVAGWRRSAGSLAKGGKSQAVKPRTARVYNGSDWRINVFQAN